jgi:hypothetical protein
LTEVKGKSLNEVKGKSLNEVKSKSLTEVKGESLTEVKGKRAGWEGREGQRVQGAFVTSALGE